MTSYMLFFAIFFTSMIGVLEILKMIYEAIFFTKKKIKTISVLPISIETENIEFFIREALLKTDGQLVVVDMGMDETKCNIISRLNEQYHRIAVVKRDELGSFIGAAC